MSPKTVRVATVAIATFVPWLIILAALGAAASFPPFWYVLVHYLLVLLLFGVSFAIYFKGHPGVRPFTVMAIAMLCLLSFELAYAVLFPGAAHVPWDYIHWFVPLFLAATVVYGVGVMFSKL